MINLLPPATREEYRYARSNRRLLPWIVALAASVLVLIAIAFYGSAALNHTADNYAQQIKSSQATLARSHVAEVKTRVGDISSSLRLVTDVLGKEVLFSKLLTRISAVVPGGVNLTGLNINQSDSAIDLNAAAINYQAATQLQANLTDPANQIFSKADLVGVNCSKKSSTDQSETNSKYPCTVDIRAQFNPSNQFLFISNTNEAKK